MLKVRLSTDRSAGEHRLFHPYDCRCGYSANLPDSDQTSIARATWMLDLSHDNLADRRRGHGRCNRSENREANRLRTFRHSKLYDDVFTTETKPVRPIDHWADIQASASALPSWMAARLGFQDMDAVTDDPPQDPVWEAEEDP